MIRSQFPWWAYFCQLVCTQTQSKGYTFTECTAKCHTDLFLWFCVFYGRIPDSFFLFFFFYKFSSSADPVSPSIWRQRRLLSVVACWDNGVCHVRGRGATERGEELWDPDLKLSRQAALYWQEARPFMNDFAWCFWIWSGIHCQRGLFLFSVKHYSPADFVDKMK